MSFEAWQLAVMEDYGYMDTKLGKLNKIAIELSESTSRTIGNEEFCEACEYCGIDPYSLTEDEIEYIKSRID